MTDLMELASRVEAGEGPDRELDAWAWWHGCADQAATDGDLIEAFNADPAIALDNWIGSRWRTEGEFPPRYTASLDAAMSLVPPHLRLMLSEWDDEEHLRSKGPWQAVLSKPGQDASFDAMRGYRCEHAATPALALTAAALRARAHQGTAHVEQ